LAQGGPDIPLCEWRSHACRLLSRSAILR
jgi:hypothetical protein